MSRVAIFNPIRIAWMLGALAALVYGLCFVASPPIEGDAYDYAEVAKNAMEQGELIQTHLLFPGLPDQQLPAPAGRRATLTALLMAPLIALFGASMWVVVLPFLLSVALLPRIILGALGPALGPYPALIGAAGTLFHPRLLQHYTYDPNVEPMLVCFVFAAFWAFRSGRLRWAGALAGLAIAVKASAVMLAPVFLTIMARHRRAGAWLRETIYAAAIATAVCAPFLGYVAWSALTEGSFGEAAMGPYLTPERVRGDFAVWFQVARAPLAVADNSLWDWLAIFAFNVERLFLGIDWPFGHRSGVLESLGWLWLPLIPFGLSAIKRAEDRDLLLLWPVALVFFYGLLALVGSDARNMAPILPITIALGVLGAERLVRIEHAKTLAMIVFLLESGPALVLTGLSTAAQLDSGRARYDALMTVKETLPESTERVITLPFMSASFYTDRLTIPLPLGTVDDVLTLSEDYEVDAWVIHREKPGPCIPESDMLRDTGSTHFCVYMLDDVATLKAQLPTEILQARPLEHQLSAHPRPSPFRGIGVLASQSVAALWATTALALFGLFVIVFLRKPEPWRGRLCVLLSALIALAAGFAAG